VVIHTNIDFDAGTKLAIKGYGKEQNFNIAFGVGSFMGTELNYDEYLDYGTVNLYYEYWDDY